MSAHLIASVLAVLGLGVAPSVWAVTVTPVNHASAIVNGSTTTLYFPTKGQVGDACENQIRASPTPGSATPALIDPTAASTLASTLLVFEIVNTEALTAISTVNSPVQASDISIRVEITNTGGGTTALTLSPMGTAFNDLTGTELTYATTAGTVVRFGIPLRDLLVANAGEVPGGVATDLAGLCQAVGGVLGKTAAAICQPVAGTAPTKFNLNFGLVAKGQSLTSTVNGTPDTTARDGKTISIVLADCPAGAVAGAAPANFSIPTSSFALAPGDQRIKIANNTISLTDSVVPVTSVLAVVDRESTPTMNSEVKQVFSGSGGGVYTVDGLTNDQQYCVALGFVNAAGFVSTTSVWGSTFNETKNAVQCTTPSQIDGFMNRSTCFIASAAYGEEWDPRLEILRQFRDQVLLAFGPGREFVDWYYSWSPGAALWIFENPAYKTVVQAALVPVVEGARLSLWIKGNMWVFGVALLLGTFALVTLRRRVT